MIFIFLIGSIDAQNYNRPVPISHPPYEFVHNSLSEDSLFYLVTPIHTSPTSSYKRYMSLLNQEGYLTWYSEGGNVTNVINFQYHEQHQLFSYASFGNSISESWFNILDDTFNKIDSIQPINGAFNDIHDFLILANGNYVLTGYKDSIMDLSAYQFNSTQGLDTTNVKAAIIQEFDSNHNLVFEWNSLDHIYPTEFIDGYTYSANSFDYVHINAVEEDFDGNFLVSMRHTDAIYKINKSTGNIMWILGGKSNQFTFINDNPGFSGQHDIRRLPNGNITLFDNANNQTTPKRSRGKEYSIDTTNMTCTKVYQYTYSPSFFARAMGNFQTLNNGDRIIGYGFIYRPYPSFVHIDNLDNIKSELFFQDSVVSYRARIANLSFINSPDISCMNNGNNSATLTAPSGYAKYEWNTGETTQSIIVSDTGTYQVWVNYGIGMLGANPLFINDIQNPCGAVGIDNADEVSKDKIILSVYDLLGRKVNNPKVAQIYVVRYTDGSAELIYWNNSYYINE
jgi:hypothetical protein